MLEVSALESFNGFLYAGTHNPVDPGPQLDGAQIYRSSDGAVWNAVTAPGFGSDHDNAPPAILDFAVFNGYLYAGTGRGNASQLWRSQNGTIWAPVDVTGFGDPDNVEVSVLQSYNGQLYAAVSNDVTGVQIWRSFTGDNNSWTQVAPQTAGTEAARVTAMTEFMGGLYAAVESEAPAQIWSSFGGEWIVDVDDGFGDSHTTMTGGMAIFDGQLFVGAGNSDSGPQLWRSADGVGWELVPTPGAEDASNEKVEMLTVFRDQLYAGIRNAQDGIELWRTSDGLQWEPANENGFGNRDNATTNASNAVASFDEQLFLGTENSVDGGELWRLLPEAGVALSPDQVNEGVAGEEVNYVVTITNTGKSADSFHLTISSNAWVTMLSAQQVTLDPSASAEFTVKVTIPFDATNQQSDTVTVIATSQADISAVDQTHLTTIVGTVPEYGVDVAGDATLSGPAGGQVLYGIAVTNIGNMVDTYDLTALANKWPTSLSMQSVTLDGGQSQEIAVTVNIPSESAWLASDQVTVRAISRYDPSLQDSATITTISIGSSTSLYLPCVLGSGVQRQKE